MSSAKTKKKKFAFDGLDKSALVALLKQQWKDEKEATNDNSEEECQEFGASSEAYVANTNPYNQELFGHDESSTLDLEEN